MTSDGRHLVYDPTQFQRMKFTQLRQSLSPESWQSCTYNKQGLPPTLLAFTPRVTSVIHATGLAFIHYAS
jgi:hypothetical protein